MDVDLFVRKLISDNKQRLTFKPSQASFEEQSVLWCEFTPSYGHGLGTDYQIRSHSQEYRFLEDSVILQRLKLIYLEMLRGEEKQAEQ